MQLFVDRVRLLRPHFRVTADNAKAVASICYRLEGIPLAIELAAAHLRTMSTEELSHRLAHRFAPPTGEAAVARDEPLRSLIESS